MRNKNATETLAYVITTVCIFVISWGLSCLFCFAIAWCFNLRMTMKIASGIYLLILFVATLKSLFGNGGDE